MNETLSRGAPALLSVLRIITALLFLQHGLQKLIGFPTLMGPFQPLLVAMPGHPELSPLLFAACIIETVTGILMVFGLLTRLAAFVASGEMAVAYFSFHVPHGGFFPVINGGGEAILFCFVFLYLVFAGAGPWSIDAAFGRATVPRRGAASPQVGTGV